MSEVNVEVVRMKLSDLKPAEYNPRKMSDQAFEGLGESINRFGLISHIVWNKRSGNIVGGHQRYKHLIEMGEMEADVIVVDLDDNEEVALNITMNNKEVRGDFTKDVVEQLRMSEAQLGSEFRKLGLLDLYDYLKGRGFDKKKREKKTTGSDPGEPGNDGPKDTHKGINDEPDEPKDTGKPQAVIVCPKCQSKWQLTDNEVVFNAVTGTGNDLGAKDAD